MKKYKMLISLAGLVAAVATTATVAAYTLAGDGSGPPRPNPQALRSRRSRMTSCPPLTWGLGRSATTATAWR